MYKFAALFIVFFAGCAPGQTPFGVAIAGVGAGTLQTQQTAGAIEVFVKTNHPALIGDIQRGGGATLTRAFDIANVPDPNRAQRTLRLQSNLAIYDSNLDALTLAILAGAR